MSSSDSRQRRVGPASTIALGAVFSLAISPLQAQEQTAGDTPTLPTVEVYGTPLSKEPSSPKHTAKAVDTPQTISVIPSTVFEEQGAQNLTDVLRNTPGISFNAGENGFGSDANEFSLRGFSTSGSVFVDGARDSGNLTRDTFNIEQVEVVKGPAADNGRTGAGGYINLQTKSPMATNAVSATVSAGFDSYDSKKRVRSTLDVNRLVGDDAAVRLNLMAENGGVAGRAHAKQKGVGIAPSVAFGLNGPTKIVLGLQHTHMSDRPEWGVPAATIAGTLNYDPAASNASRDTFYGLMGDTDKTRATALTARVEHQVSANTSIGNYTRWSRTDRDVFSTAPTNYSASTQQVTTQRWGYTRENTAIANLTNLSHAFNTGSLSHTLAAGVELSHEKSDSGRHPTANAGNVSVFHPDPNRLPGGDIPATQFGHVKITTAAVYAYDTIRFSPQWEVTGGLRAERYKVSLSSKNLAGEAQGAMDGYSRTETTLGGKMGLVYKPTTFSSVYLSYGLSAVPPGSWLSNPDSGREGNNAFPGWDGQNYQDSKEQKLSNWELGTKWSLLNDSLNLTAAAFRTERKNVAMRAASGTNYPSGYGKQTVQGLELGVDGAITRNWNVFGGVVFLNSKRSHSAEVDQALKSDYGSYTSTNGDELAFTPKRTFNLWTTYRFGNGLTLGAGAQHSASAWVGRPDVADRVIPNGASGKVPGYTVYNLMAAYELTPNVRLRLNIDNVADKTYVSAMNWSARRARLGAPRSYLLSADIRF